MSSTLSSNIFQTLAHFDMSYCTYLCPKILAIYWDLAIYELFKSRVSLFIYLFIYLFKLRIYCNLIFTII